MDKLMIAQVELSAITEKRKQRYLLSYLEIITIICSVLLIRSGTPESLRKKQALWQHMAETDPWSYERLCRRPMCRIARSPGRTAMWAAKCGYRLSQRMFGFN